MQNILMPHWGVSSGIIIEEARQQGYKTKILSEKNNLFSVNNGPKKIYFKSVDCGINSSFGLKVSNNKELTYRIAEENNIRVPKSIYINRDEGDNIDAKLLNIKYPVISKPIDGAHGEGVALNLHTISQLKEGIKYSFSNKKTERIVIQEQIKGNDYRIIVLHGKVIAVTQRIPPIVTGDGQLSIKELIHLENNHPHRKSGFTHGGNISKILVDQEAISYIHEQGYKLDSIPEQGVIIHIRKNTNLSTGGLAIDVTESIHESIKNEAIKITKICGLSFCGVDYFCKDISQTIGDGNGAIIEINATPGIRMHHYPSQGSSRNVAGMLLQNIFST